MVRRKQEYWQGEPEEFTEDQGGTQHWQGLDGVSVRVKEDYPRPIPASAVYRLRRRSIPRTTGHNFTGQVSAVQPDICPPIGIIAPLLTRHRAAPWSQTDPGFCSIRFPDGAGYGRRPGDP